jgi:tagatose 1,6-diphosphate aldolase
MAFKFSERDLLTDGVIDLVVEKREPADPSKGYVPAYHYKVTVHGSAEKIGEIRLRVGNLPSLLTSGHIGYSIAADHRGHGYASRACLLVGTVALSHGLRRLTITCDPGNIPSRRTCERIGAVLQGIFDVPPDHPMYREGKRTVCRYEWFPRNGKE